MKSKIICMLLCLTLLSPCFMTKNVSATENSHITPVADSNANRHASQVIGNTIVSIGYITDNHFLKSIVSTSSITVEEYSEGELISSTSIPNTTVDVYSEIAKMQDIADYSATLRSSGYGTVTYNPEPGKSAHKLQISADVVGTKNGTFTYNKEGRDLTKIAAYLMDAFGLVFPPTVLAGIIFHVLSDSVSATVSGTMTSYRLHATDPETDRTKSFDGCRYEGTVEGEQKTLYEKYYPQFIERKDTVVAGWLHNDFWGNYNTPQGW